MALSPLADTLVPPAAGRRIGLMGGTFDPIHQAHLALAHAALIHLTLDEVRWIPVGQAWQKARQLTPAEHRLAMVRAATHDEPRFVVDPIEVERAGPSYTVDTVKALQAAAGDDASGHWFLIIGQDQYANLPTWLGWQDLIRRVTLAVARRGEDQPAAPATLKDVPHHVIEVPLPPWHVSSTEVRRRLAQGDPPHALVPDLLPGSVAGYIAQHQLYAPAQPPLNGHP